MRSALLLVSLLAVLPFTSAVPTTPSGSTFRNSVTSPKGRLFQRSGCYGLGALKELSPPLSPEKVNAAACINGCELRLPPSYTEVWAIIGASVVLPLKEARLSSKQIRNARR